MSAITVCIIIYLIIWRCKVVLYIFKIILNILKNLKKLNKL